ncbi:MAG: HD domain-containing protein [Vicinamibacteria bacterium]
MKTLVRIGAAVALLVATGVVASAQSTTPPPTTTTPAGIVLDAPWKQAIFKLATEKLQHSAWGVGHSERDYLLATRLAAEDKLVVDTDILFAAAFLHDVAAFPSWSKEGIDHTDRAAEVVPEILTSAGFPATKIEAVQEAVRNHMYYRADATRPEAIVLHDADTLDFLGAIGVARIISLTTRQKGWAPDLATAVKTLDGFSNDLPSKVTTVAGRKRAATRAAEMKGFLETLKAESENGKAW